MKRAVFAVLLITIALVERLWFDLGPNIELVTVVMLLAAAYLDYRWSLLVVAGVMGVSDLVLGNTRIFLFTWSAFALAAVGAGSMFSRFRLRSNSLVLFGTGMGVGSSLFFYLWTNFGVWWLDSWGMYADDLSGLVASYINAWPFLKLSLVSTLVFVPLGFGIVESVRFLLANKSLTRKQLLRMTYFYV